MNVTYQRELNEAYMILEGDEECEEYALRILQENHLKGIMPLSIREVDGERDYWFAISDGKPLDRILEKRSLEYEEVCQIIRSIGKILGQVEEYLLNPEHLILDPAFLYLGTRTLPRRQGHSYHETDFAQVMVCCHPAWSRDFYEQMRILMQFFINKMDHRDAQGVEAAYQMFHVTEKEYFRMEELLQIIERTRHPVEDEDATAGKNPESKVKSEQQRRGTERESKRMGRTMKAKESSGSFGKDGDGAFSSKSNAGFREKPRRMNTRESKDSSKVVALSDRPQHKAGSGSVMRKVPVILAILLQLAGALLFALAAWIWYRMGWVDTMVIGGAVICLALGLLVQRSSSKKENTDERKNRDNKSQAYFEEQVRSTGGQITDSYVNYLKDEYREKRNYREGGTELLTGSFPGRSTPVLVSENLTEQENIPLGTMPFTLGSGEDVNGHLDWSTISREHAVVECQGGQYSLKDCHSTNGTFLNGRKLEAEQWYPLRFGDEIVLANRGFIFRPGI